jgi:hydroxymethylpyrimidine pyrophosphatase-like HAD family hydrolase
MYFLALAADYDGTLAHHGVVDRQTCEALRQLKQSGRRLLLVTGRELPHLKAIFPELNIFDRVVAENGALVYDPRTQEERLIAEPPPDLFVQQLKRRGVAPISVGRSIVATWEPHETTVLEVIRELGLELQIIFNKGAVMVLPAGINKAAGLAAALSDLDISAHNVVAVGDAENDHAFLSKCGCAAAVANALPMVKAESDIRLAGDHGRGVIELIDRIEREDARIVPPSRHGILCGVDRAGAEVFLQPYHGSTLIAGRSGSGKSTFAIALTERMADKNYEFCVFDPEGDYKDLKRAVAVGDASSTPLAADAIKILGEAGSNVVVNTQTMLVPARGAFLSTLLPRVSHLRARTGRPHWLVIDEAHQILPAGEDVQPRLGDMPAAILITLHPEWISRELLHSVEVVVAFGRDAAEILQAFAAATGRPAPEAISPPRDGEFLFWPCAGDDCPCPVRAVRPRQAHIRHAGKYAHGDVGPVHAFYFRGPDGALHARAHNLTSFLTVARRLDDRVWERHLRSGDYQAWFRDVIKDEDLARETAEVQADTRLDPQQSRDLIGEAVRRRYAIPAIASARC